MIAENFGDHVLSYFISTSMKLRRLVIRMTDIANGEEVDVNKQETIADANSKSWFAYFIFTDFMYIL